MIRVQAWNEFASPKFYGPLTIWPWLKISPQSSLNVIYCLILTSWQWLMGFPYTPCIPMQIKPIKGCQGKGFRMSLESGCEVPFPPQDSVNLSRLSHNAADTACQWPIQTCPFIFLKKSKLKALPSISRVRKRNLGSLLTWGSRDKNSTYDISHPHHPCLILSPGFSLGRFKEFVLICSNPRSAPNSDKQSSLDNQSVIRGWV